jgi:hypothetical protein
VVWLAKVITPENTAAVLPRFLRTSKDEAKAIAAELCPAEAPPRRDVVTPLARAPAAASRPLPLDAPRLDAPVGPRSIELVLPGEPRHSPEPCPPAARQVPVTPPAKRDGADPLTADLSRLHVTVSRRFLAKLAAARDALSHSVPNGEAEAVLEAGLDLILAACDRRRGLVEKPRKSQARPTANPRYVPADVRRAVFIRDEGQCQWPLAAGGICGSRTRLELDHIIPVALGGTSTVPNLHLACRFHNGLAARKVFGDELMDGFRSHGRGKAPPSEPPATAAARPASSSPPASAPRQAALPLG